MQSLTVAAVQKNRKKRMMTGGLFQSAMVAHQITILEAFMCQILRPIYEVNS